MNTKTFKKVKTMITKMNPDWEKQEKEWLKKIKIFRNYSNMNDIVYKNTFVFMPSSTIA